MLAAGFGTRMRSELPKPLHPLAGRPMIEHVLRAGAAVKPIRTLVVVGSETRDLPDRIGRPDVVAVPQPRMLGTGDALRCALPYVRDAAYVVVLFADHPLLTEDTVRNLIGGAQVAKARATVLSCLLPAAGAYGRVARDEAGHPLRIVEAKDDDPRLRVGTTEINSGMMVLDVKWAERASSRMVPSARTGEYYLTSFVELAVEDGPLAEGGWPVATVLADPEVSDGINNRIELAKAETLLRDRIRKRFMEQGVTFVGPESSFVDDDVEIGSDTSIWPGCVIKAGTRIGRNCDVGPYAVLERATLADGSAVRQSTVVESSVGPGADVGPYAHVRGGSVIGDGAHVGTSAELKAAKLGAGTKVGHFSYVGDAVLGTGVNIGAGTVTANFDGRDKHQTIVGDGAFIGSDSVLVAPVSVGAGSKTGAGSVVTHDVPAGTTVVGVPARQFGNRPKGDPESGSGEPEAEGT